MVDEMESKLLVVFNSCDKDFKSIFCNTCEFISKLEPLEDSKAIEQRNMLYLKLGKKLWEIALNEENIYKMFFVYVVIWRLELDPEEIKKNSNINSLITISVKTAKHFNFKLNFINSVRQYGRDINNEYVIACNNSNQLAALYFFENTINVQRTYNPGRYDFEILNFIIEFIHFIHIDGITTLFERKDPLISELVINSLSKELLLNYFISNLDLHEYILIRFFYYYVKQFSWKYDPNSNIGVPYNKLKVIIIKLQNLSYWGDIYQEYINMGQLKCNYVFHYCCGFLDFELDNFSELYVKNIDFSHEENRYGEALWKSLCEANKLNTINELSTKIYGKLINHIENLAKSDHRFDVPPWK